MWLPFRPTIVKPARWRALTTLRPDRTGSAIVRDLYEGYEGALVAHGAPCVRVL